MKATRTVINGQSLGELVGLILAHDVRRPNGRGTLFRKGHCLTETDLGLLAEAPGLELHLLDLGPSDVHEDEAGRRLAEAIAGPGVHLSAQKQSRIHVLADHHGLLSIDQATVTDLNLIPGVCVYTIYDGLVVDPDEAVAAAKVVPLAVPEASVAEAEGLAARAAPVVRVDAFRPLRVDVIAREDLDGRARERFEAALRRKIGWYGSSVGEIVYVPADTEEIAGALRRAAAAGAGLILTAGANAVDPLDPMLQALDRTGARMEQYGAPAHPGSLFWLAKLGEIPILGLASCGMYSEATSVDLILPRVFAGQELNRVAIARLGHGGLLRKDMAFRFPRYDGAGAPEAV